MHRHPTLTHRAHHGAAAPTAHCTGSATILVVVLLVMLAMLGATYLQVMRFEQRARTGEDSHIDAAIDSVIDLMKQRLKEDVLDDNDNKFNPASPDAGGADEFYDHPWTNSSVKTDVTTPEGSFPSGDTEADGGEYDDLWLASAAPRYDSQSYNDGNGYWPHISNLTQVFLSNGGNARLGTGGELPDAYATGVNEGVNRYTDTGVTIQDQDTAWDDDNNGPQQSPDYATGQLVDADGDGIGDSKWQWAPLHQVGDTQWVFAPRIIDLSSKLNANVATSAHHVGDDKYGGFDTGNAGDRAPRGTTPSEWDLAGYVEQYRQSLVSDAEKYLERFLKYRMGMEVNDSLPNGTQLPYTEPMATSRSQPDRRLFWEEAGRYRLGEVPVGPDLPRHMGIDDELELLHGNGLNRSVTAQIEHRDHGLWFLKRRATVTRRRQESHYAQAMGSTPTAREFFWDDGTGYGEPRKALTVSSGAADYAPRVTGDGTTNTEMRTEINTELDSDNLDQIKQVIQDVYSENTPSTLPGGFDDAEQFADQFTANIKDYYDEDENNENQLTRHNGKVGLEALPFIAEVYVQGRYEITSENAGATPTEKNYPVELQGEFGYAIEVVNPFPRQISLKNVELAIDGTVRGADLATMAGQNNLGPGQSLVIYRHSNGNTASEDNIEDLFDSPPDVTASASWSWPTDGDGGTQTEDDAVPISSSDVPITLRVPASSGRDVDYSGTNTVIPSSSFTIEDTDTNTEPNYSNGNVDYYQHSAVGNGDGLNVLTVASDEFARSTEQTELNDNAGGASLASPALDRLGASNKTDKTDAPENEIKSDNLNHQQLIISDHGRINHIGELAQIAVLGPDPDSDKTVGDVWDEVEGNGNGDDTDGTPPSRVADFHIRLKQRDAASNYSDTAPLTGTTVAVNRTEQTTDRYVSHAVLLMDQFTTLDRSQDFVPGKINLNTAPRWILDAALPIASEGVRDRVINAIMDQRRNPNRVTEGSSPPSAGDPAYREGLAYAGEMMWPLMDPNDDDNNNMPGNDGSDTQNVGGVRVDFEPDDLDDLDGSQMDGIIDDREERIMLTKWLHQMATTRSDVFAAYFVVHGYPSGDFRTNDNEPVESARVIVIFDRSNVETADDEVEVIGQLRVY